MIKQCLITDKNHPIEPDDAHPFVVLTYNSQPMSLIALKPFTGKRPPSENKTVAVLVVPRYVSSVEENLPKVILAAQTVIWEAIDAEGVVLIDEEGEIYGVLPTQEVLAPDENDLRNHRQTIRLFEGLPGEGDDVPASVVFSCPKPNCLSPDYTLWQVGIEIPPCPIHGIPREPKYEAEDKNAT